jgi:uncharacterized membrane protein YgdD (TMEM256/DUF423 family)
MAMGMLVSTKISVLLATGLMLLVNGLLGVFGNLATGVINHNVSSKYRATALSGYNMLASMPYLFMALFVGRFIDLWSIDVVIWMWSALLTGLVMFWGWLSYSK